MENSQHRIADFLPRGALSLIAAKVGITRQGVSQALKVGKPGNPAVQEAMRMVQESRAIETSQLLASLK